MDLTVSFPGGKRVDATVGGFTIRTDQPANAGGEGSAPEPFTLFLASLGTCAGIYVVGFCQSRNIPLEGVSIHQDWEYEPETRRLARVRLDIRVPDSFPKKYLAAVKNAAEGCKVKKTLLAPPEISVTTTVAGVASSDVVAPLAR